MISISFLKLESERGVYRTLGEFGARLYFVLADLVKLNTMYQFSLNEFLGFYQIALASAEVRASLCLPSLRFPSYYRPARSIRSIETPAVPLPDAGGRHHRAAPQGAHERATARRLRERVSSALQERPPRVRAAPRARHVPAPVRRKRAPAPAPPLSFLLISSHSTPIAYSYSYSTSSERLDCSVSVSAWTVLCCVCLCDRSGSGSRAHSCRTWAESGPAGCPRGSTRRTTTPSPPSKCAPPSPLPLPLPFSLYPHPSASVSESSCVVIVHRDSE